MDISFPVPSHGSVAGTLATGPKEGATRNGVHTPKQLANGFEVLGSENVKHDPFGLEGIDTGGAKRCDFSI
jgi:hypothetical protein